MNYSSTQDLADESGMLLPKANAHHAKRRGVTAALVALAFASGVAFSNLNWCGCATTSSPDPSKQTVGYSGRCSQGAGDYYTKYKDLATQICNRA